MFNLLTLDHDRCEGLLKPKGKLNNHISDIQEKHSKAAVYELIKNVYRNTWNKCEVLRNLVPFL